MLSCVSAWILSALVAQTPTEPRAVLLEKIPADAAVVVSLRGIDKVQADLEGMLTAMSPTWGGQAGPMLRLSIGQMTAQFGTEATRSPFTVAMDLPKADGELPAFAVLIPIEDYRSVLKSLAGTVEAPKLEAVGGGVEKFTNKTGDTIYAYDGEGFIAFAQESDAMVKRIAAKPAATLGSKLSTELREALLGGDLGFYINVAAIQARYGDQIEAMRAQFMAALDQAGDQMQQQGQMNAAKQLYGALFDAAKEAESLALNFDFDKAAFDLSAFLTLKTDSPALASLKNAKTGNSDGLAKLPPGYLVYGYMNTDPKSMQGLMKMNASSTFPGGASGSPAAQKYLDSMMELGRQESLTAMTYGGGVEVLALTIPENVEQTTSAMVELMKTMAQSPAIKEATLEEKVDTYKGFVLNKASMRFDFEKMLGDQAGNPMAAGMVKAMVGEDGATTTYFGSDGKQLVSATAKSLEEAHQKIDQLSDEKAGIGTKPGYQALMSRLPKETNALFAVNAQRLVRFIGQILGTVAGGDPIAPPADMPTEMALFGGSLATHPSGYRLDFVLPSAVGPVLEKGLVPIVQGIQGQVNQ